MATQGRFSEPQGVSGKYLEDSEAFQGDSGCTKKNQRRFRESLGV